MQEVVCPPCGTVIRGQDEEHLITSVQAHAQEFHGHSPTREEILSTARPAGETRA